jgi:UDP-glucose 4-epimerase
MARKTQDAKILVTGGAGYVGSVVTEELLASGRKVVVVDDLRQGHRDAVAKDAELVIGDIRDEMLLDDIFKSAKVDAVVHLAADSIIGASMIDPRVCLENNVIGGMTLLKQMLKHKVTNFVFSSSAAVYGEPRSVPIDESHPTEPINTYGESKLLFERILVWYGRAYDLKYISLRYFNAAGASERFGEDHRPESHLVPCVLAAAGGKVASMAVFGNDYPTKDGSCVRDYIHVVDIAQAHILALKKLKALSGRAYNLGSGSGCSVLQVIKAARKITGADIPVQFHARRTGDPAVLVASCDLAKKELGWQPAYTKIEDIIESAWRWKRNYPDGYRK